MRKKIPFEWEQISDVPGISATARAKTCGGWIVHVNMISGKAVSSTMVFVPDPEHGWIIPKPEPVKSPESEGAFV